MQDLDAAVAYLRARPDVDAARMVIGGGRQYSPATVLDGGDEIVSREAKLEINNDPASHDLLNQATPLSSIVCVSMRRSTPQCRCAMLSPVAAK